MSGGAGGGETRGRGRGRAEGAAVRSAASVPSRRCAVCAAPAAVRPARRDALARVCVCCALSPTALLHWLCVRAARLSVCARCSLCFFFAARRCADRPPKREKKRKGKKKGKEKQNTKQNSGQASANQPSDRWTTPDQPTLSRNDNEPTDSTRAQRPLARRHAAAIAASYGKGPGSRRPSRLI